MRMSRGIDAASPSLLLSFSPLSPLVSDGVGEHVLRRLDEQDRHVLRLLDE